MFSTCPFVRPSVRPFIRPLPNSEDDILKTKEPISMQIDTSACAGLERERINFGVRRSKIKVVGSRS